MKEPLFFFKGLENGWENVMEIYLHIYIQNN
jgi:hypothetical protein